MAEGGVVTLSTHDNFSLLPHTMGHPVRYFIEPVIVAVNYLSQKGFSTPSMAGISGGGWTTTWAAALDTRIARSFPVAGTYPTFLREERDIGDWEQTTQDLYGQAGYLDLYVLGSHGKGRAQLQILNRYDPCCFAGDKWRAYRDVVRDVVSASGDGDFDVWEDATHHEHAVSPAAMERIVNALKVQPGH
jgi:hypothetical protein